MYPVIYLTGAPATGKSTLSRNLRKNYPALFVFAYSEELRGLIASKRGGSPVGEDEIREKSGLLVTPEDVAELDNNLIKIVRYRRAIGPVLIDSHPVTKEAYGFRITGFTIENLRALSPDVIVCLYASSDIIIERLSRNPMGRPIITAFEATMHSHLQASFAAGYGVQLGKPVYLFDSSVAEGDLASIVAEKARL